MPRPDPVDLTLHIGTDKTGTTTIQSFLKAHRDVLRRQGILYPRSLGPGRHFRFGMLAESEETLVRSQAWIRRGYTDIAPDQFRRRGRRRLFKELNESRAKSLLVSDEGLFGSSNPKIDRIAALATELGRSIRLIAYVRRQDDHLVSNYQQRVKQGEFLRLSSFAEVDRSGLYDYHAKLSNWQRHLGPDATVVRPFERDRFLDGDLVTDFLDATGLDIDPTLERAGARNESLSAESVEFLRLLNLFHIEELGTHPWAIKHRELIHVLTELDGPTLTLPAEQLDRLMARYEQSNVETARTFAGLSSGVLFERDRRTTGTTTVQRFDPDRLGVFLELASVPERHHKALRSIAEREAGVG